jgi:hypothetical protein
MSFSAPFTNGSVAATLCVLPIAAALIDSTNRSGAACTQLAEIAAPMIVVVEWPAEAQQKEPELAALMRIGLPALPSLVRLRDSGPGNRTQQIYWRFWKNIPTVLQKRLTPPQDKNTQWKMDVTELICMEILCHRNDSGASTAMRPLFDEALKIARSGDFRDGTHFNVLGATAVDEPAAESVLLKEMRAKKVTFLFESASAAAALPDPSDEICDELVRWMQQDKGYDQREIAFEAVGYLSRKRARLREALWNKFLEADPADQGFWMTGLRLQMYPDELAERMRSKIREWLEAPDPKKSRFLEIWRSFLRASQPVQKNASLRNSSGHPSKYSYQCIERIPLAEMS